MMGAMPLITFVTILFCIAIVLYLVKRYMPDPQIKKIATIAIVISTIFWVLNLFGVFGPLTHLHVGR